jgi:hypothetical protein
MVRLFLSLLLSFAIFLSFGFAYAQPARALIREQEEAPGQMLYQSRHSLRDGIGSPWQVVLFKRVKNGEVKDVSLRLVGFPDGIEFLHPQSLRIVTAMGAVFEASDLFAAKAPAPNVGQYDFREILAQLQDSQPLELALPLETKRSLSIPLPVILEWQELRS